MRLLLVFCTFCPIAEVVRAVARSRAIGRLSLPGFA